ncbi:S9 family peptidase [Pseudoxanthomonas mexicana]|uniref:S9 family peptidase n=1 Tax=Pseudoxanthomonas mexicana TaxID=128785 RepID=UPI00209D953B|nr:S9 family peptidase [Pseudoxanthomonas mexicana]MCP1582055.1 dipeptidyl aminopeptidase/acylaminoacyl peptidase [Pseudoxanthomonas mexicana]
MKTPAVEDLFHHVALASLTAGWTGWVWVATSIDREGDTTRSAVWSYTEPGGLRRVTADGYGPAWPRVGEDIAFLRAADGASQVFVQHPDATQAEQISHVPEGVASIEHWDKDRRRLLIRVTKEDDAHPDAPKRVSHLPYKLDGSGVIADQRTELHRLCTESGISTHIGTGEGDVLEAKWSPDGRTVALVRRRAGAQRHRMDLCLVEPSGHVRQATDTLVSISGLSWSPDGAYIAMAASTIEGDSVSHLCVWQSATGQVRHVGDIEMTLPSAIQWADEGGRLLVTQAHQGMQRVVMTDLQGHIDVVWEDAQHQVFGMAAMGHRIGVFIAGPNEGMEFHRGEGMPPTFERITSFNAWRTARPAMRATKRIFDVPDGGGGRESIEGWYMTPEGPGPFPVLLDMHGGPHSMVTFEYERQVHWPVLVARGWAIVALNAVGSSSYGRAFAHRIRGRWGELDLPQWEAALSALREAGVAGDQVACFGHSYGGYLAAWALCHRTPLIGGVVSGAVINLESHTGTSDSGYYVGPYALDSELTEARERYRRLSPISHVENIDTPVLILQGENDERCPIGQAEELLSALIRNGRARAEMVLFPGGSHHVSSTGRPSHRVVYYERLVDWLGRLRIAEGGARQAGSQNGMLSDPDDAGVDNLRVVSTDGVPRPLQLREAAK